MKVVWKERLAALVPALMGRSVWVFGTGKGGGSVASALQDHGVKVAGFLDNRVETTDTFNDLPVKPPAAVENIDARTLAIVIASQTYLDSMEDQLVRLGLTKGIHYYCPMERLRKVDAHAVPSTLSRTTRKYDGDFTWIFLSRDRTRGVSLTLDETYTLYQGVRTTSSLPGCIAEMGVYRGGSARIMCEAKGDTPLFLCDTFEGMPALENEHDTLGVWVKTHTNTSMESVREYLAPYPNVHFVKGIFPDSLANHGELGMASRQFRFVHLDVDLYESTMQGLQWFWPRMVSGGWLVSHNYNLTYGKWGDTPGVKKAFLEYFKSDACRIVEIADTHALIVKP